MNLRRIRDQRNLSQEQLAVLSGLNVRTIQRLEKGSRPSLESLKCLAAALDVDVVDITGPPEATAGSARPWSVNACFILLAAAAIFALFGAKAEAGSAEIGAFFYIAAAICFVATSALMFKDRTGTTF